MARIHDALTSEKEEDQHHDQCVAEVQEGGGCSCDVRDRAIYKRILARGEVSWTFVPLAPRKTSSFTVHGNRF